MRFTNQSNAEHRNSAPLQSFQRQQCVIQCAQPRLRAQYDGHTPPLEYIDEKYLARNWHHETAGTFDDQWARDRRRNECCWIYGDRVALGGQMRRGGSREPPCLGEGPIVKAGQTPPSVGGTHLP